MDNMFETDNLFTSPNLPVVSSLQLDTDLIDQGDPTRAGVSLMRWLP